jgi:predicted kinase
LDGILLEDKKRLGLVLFREEKDLCPGIAYLHDHMNKPLLIVVTGRPASGKSTLAHILAKEIKCPLLSRDELKEGYLNTLGLQHAELDHAAAWYIYHAFFEVIGVLLSKGISLIVEAAFQDQLWKPQLSMLRDKAEIKVILCELSPALATARFEARLLNDPDRDRFHGDAQVREKGGLYTAGYEPVAIDVPTLKVDTTQQYDPAIRQIIAFVRAVS